MRGHRVLGQQPDLLLRDGELVPDHLELVRLLVQHLHHLIVLGLDVGRSLIGSLDLCIQLLLGYLMYQLHRSLLIHLLIDDGDGALEGLRVLLIYVVALQGVDFGI